MAHADFDPLGSDPKEVTVTLDSSAPRMLVYMQGSSKDESISTADHYDLKVPPTIPGFVVPEVAVGTVMAVASMFTALGLFAYKKRQKPTPRTSVQDVGKTFSYRN